jgi:hypothetical protein
MKFWRFYFAFVAVFNLFIGALMIFAGQQCAAMFGLSGAGATYAMGLTGVFVAVLGLGYAMAAWNPGPNRSIITLGALSKSIASVVVSYHAYLGHISHGVFIGGLVDLAMAALFALYLHQTRKTASA